ncbi:hypothetical protein [Nonomuraea endophytica]|uniref:hypothetical protein n=1 Tax=Nonomuraea endophytica TaxID=714136 RepID=UPI0037CB15BE
MADQFDVIEAGEKGRRRWIGIVVLVAVLAVPVVGLLASRSPEAEPPARPTANPIPTLTTLTSAPNVLHAKAHAKGADEVIQVVFPHGLRADVRYPAELGLDDLGSRPFVGLWIAGGEFSQYRQLTAPYGGDIEVTRGEKPLRSFTGNVTLWPRPPGAGLVGQVMLFAFGPWRMAMYDRPTGMRFEQRMELATSLKGTVTKDGYLVLKSSGQIRLAAPGDGRRSDPVGPQLLFGGGSSDMLALVPTPGCALPEVPNAMGMRGRHTESVCMGDFMVAASGSREFVRTAVSKIRITPK